MCKALRPSIVVETGVHYGSSSAFILKALQEVGGNLWSIDLPNVSYRVQGGCHSDILPRGKKPGFAVPESLRAQWHLILGDTHQVLPRLLKSLGYVDIFFHDSQHTYDTMMFEYETAWPYLRRGGLLLSDDVNWNNAFTDFANEVGAEYICYKGKGAILVK